MAAKKSPARAKPKAATSKKAGKKFDMGKSCLRFKSLDDLELKSLGKVIGSVTPGQYLEMYKRVKWLD
jgi:hypothetical protein